MSLGAPLELSGGCDGNEVLSVLCAQEFDVLGAAKSHGGARLALR